MFHLLSYKCFRATEQVNFCSVIASFLEKNLAHVSPGFFSNITLHLITLGPTIQYSFWLLPQIAYLYKYVSCIVELQILQLRRFSKQFQLVI